MYLRKSIAFPLKDPYWFWIITAYKCINDNEYAKCSVQKKIWQAWMVTDDDQNFQKFMIITMWKVIMNNKNLFQ